MANSKQIVYLSQTQYAELIANGTITVNGVTVTYDENDIYVTPQAEPVTDVRVAGTSVSSNGIANVPIAGANKLGVVMIRNADIDGLNIGANGEIQTYVATDRNVKAANNSHRPLVATLIHNISFYGLTKAAGVDMANSDNAVGTYTPEAKGAIQKMLGVSDLIATEENNLTASKPYAIGDIFTANGKLYKATAAIAQDAAIILPGEVGENCEEVSVADGFVKFTDYATANKGGVVIVGNAGGLYINPNNGVLQVSGASRNNEIKKGSNLNKPIVPYTQDMSTFYGLAKAAGADEKDSTLPVGEYTDTAKSAIRTMLGAVGSTDKASTSTLGLVKISNNGISIDSGGNIYLAYANEATIKSGNSTYAAITSANQHTSVFYGLAKASGDTTQSASSNAVGTYTDSAKASIKAMLGIQDGSTGTVDVSGTTPTITAVENTRYVCGEVTSLSFTPPASGISIVRFTSGSTVTVLTIPSTVKFPEWFDPTSLETDTIYEICVTDGVYGAVMSWAL